MILARALLAAILLVLSSVHAETITGRVVGVTDGDTLTVLDDSRTQRKVRIAGVDAPERKQPFGERSRQNLAALAFQKLATVDCYKVDRYRRLVCRVFVAGRDVALAQVEAGLAWHYKRFQNEQTQQERASYAQAEETARREHRGLWRDVSPVPPWEWRRARASR